MHKRRNRKTVTKDGWITYKGERLEICNSQKYGVYKQTVLAFIDQLDVAITIHKRVLVINLIGTLLTYNLPTSTTKER